MKRQREDVVVVPEGGSQSPEVTTTTTKRRRMSSPITPKTTASDGLSNHQDYHHHHHDLMDDCDSTIFVAPLSPSSQSSAQQLDDVDVAVLEESAASPATSALSSPLTSLTSLSSLSFLMDEPADLIQQHQQHQQQQQTSLQPTQSLSPLATTLSPDADCTGWLSPAAMQSSPSMAATRELVQHFATVLSPLLLFDVDNNNPATTTTISDDGCPVSSPANPFRDLLVPLAALEDNNINDEAACVTPAMCAIAAAHMELTGAPPIEGAEPSGEYHSLALSRLAAQIESGSSHEMGLATIMLLVSYETLVCDSPSDMMEHHLRGAQSMLGFLQGTASPLISFLERQFRFYDVIFALSVGTDPIGQAPALGRRHKQLLTRSLAPLAAVSAANDPPFSIVDDLWPVLHRLSTMRGTKRELDSAMSLRQVARAAVLRSEIGVASRAIEAVLAAWMPPSSPDLDDASNPSSHLALAYCHGALVYLYRHIHGYPHRHQLVQMNAHSALLHCAAAAAAAGSVDAVGESGNVPAHAGLLWPLFTAACEALDAGRTMARQAFDAMRRRHSMANVNQVWSVVEHIWAQFDGVACHGLRPDDTFGAWRRAETTLGLKIILA